MLTVTLHAVPVANAAFNNRLGWMEVAYASKPAPISDYKAVVFSAHVGASPQLTVQRYPRYAGTIWDLVARVLAVYLRPADEKVPAEQLWPFEPNKKFIPYVTAISAVIEMAASMQGQRARQIATCEVARHSGARGRYQATFTEDCLGEKYINSFVFRPLRLVHWELLQHAIAHRLSPDGTIPPRPFVFAPDSVKDGEHTCVRVADLTEPAQTCFSRWLARKGFAAELECGLAQEKHYVEFLHALS